MRRPVALEFKTEPPKAKTADERERRFVEYVSTLNKGEIAELRLTRMNRIANFRKALMQLLNDLIETRAEDLAAAMLMEHAPERPKKKPAAVVKGRLPLPAPAERKRSGRKMPRWVREAGDAAPAAGSTWSPQRKERPVVTDP